MANEQNLKPIRDSKRARELQEKAAQKQRENIAKKKTLKQELEILMETISKDGRTYQELMSTAVLKEALKGNTKAYEIIRDTLGQKPKEVIETTFTNSPIKELVDSIDKLKKEEK